MAKFQVIKGLPIPTKEAKRESIVPAMLAFLHDECSVGDALEIPRPAGQVRMARNKMRERFAESGQDLCIIVTPIVTADKSLPKTCRAFKVDPQSFRAAVVIEG